MPRPNQISIDDDREEYICISCDDRYFATEQGLIQHCQKAKIHQHEWCDRCDWLFVSPSARAEHIRNSLNHWLCSFCGTDLYDKNDLRNHQEQHHKFCTGCGVKFDDFVQHRIKSHNRCSTCQREFDNENNLVMHRQVHLPLSLECYGCTRRFASTSAILIHLESGNCSSGVTENEIDTWAFECYQSRHYTNDWNDMLRFRCPECDNDFKNVSGLFQHVESPACSAAYEKSILKLKKYLIQMVE